MIPFLVLADSGWGSTIVAAVISAGAMLVVALIAIGGIIYQTRQSKKIEREKDEQQRRHDQELELFRRQLDIQHREKEQEEAAQHEMRMAQDNVARAGAYRKALHVDPQISRLQILDMQRPLEITNIYIRIHLHEDTIVRYTIDPTLATAAQQRNPDSFFQARHHYLEQRVMTAVDPDTAIRKHHRCVIVGDPGAGKTTLLKYLVLMLADGKYPDLSDLPIHIELNAFVSSEERDILDYAAHRWEERYVFPYREAHSYMDTMLRDGKAILLLDALDETVVGEQLVQADASYQKAWEAIMRLATRYPQACIVVTARKAGYQQHRSLDGFAVLEVMDFRRKDIYQFINNWFCQTQGATQTAKSNDLIARLDRNPRIQALAANPLLLSLIVLVYEAQLDLPDRRAELYRECIDILLAKWDAKRNIRRRRSFKPDQKRQLLAEVAWQFHQQGRRYFPEQDLLMEIARFLPALGLSADDNQQVLQEIASENGLLKEQAHGWYGFLHLTLQEYFAAISVYNPSRLTSLVSQCADPWWEEVLLLYAGQTPDASPLLLHLLGKGSANARKDDLFHTNLLMAGRCLASSPTIRQKGLREEIIERIFALFVQTSYTRLREQIINVLVTLGGDAIISRLVALHRDIHIQGDMGTAAARALKRLEKISVAQDLLRMLKDKQLEDRTRADIAWELGQLGELSVAQDLLEILKDNQVSNEVRGRVAIGLGHLGEPSVVPELVVLLKDNQIAVGVREDIARALGWLEELSVAQDMMEMLKDSQIADEIRSSIALALGQLGELSVTPELVALLKNSQIAVGVREDIAQALEWLGEPSVVPDLLKMLKDNRIADGVRSRITLALGKLGKQAVIPDLLKMLKDNRIADRVRNNIALALGELGEQTVIPDLVRILKDTQIDSMIRGGAAEALEELGGQLMISDLVHVLEDTQTDFSVSYKVAGVLGRLVQDEQTIKTCALLLSHVRNTGIADNIYSALWNMSRRAGGTIVVQNDDNSEIVEFVSWQRGVGE